MLDGAAGAGTAAIGFLTLSSPYLFFFLAAAGGWELARCCSWGWEALAARNGAAGGGLGAKWIQTPTPPRFGFPFFFPVIFLQDEI